jgi:hypothetical protein
MKRKRTALLWGVVILTAAMAAHFGVRAAPCALGSRVDVSVTFAGSGGNERVERLYVHTSGNKAFRSSLAPGETAHLLLDPEGEQPQLVLGYTLHGKRLGWDGPEFPPGTGYRMVVTIDSQGAISERHCMAPCCLR